MNDEKTDIKQECIDVAIKSLPSSMNAADQIEHIFSYAASDQDFASVLKSDDKRVQAELKSQIKYICSLGIDAAKGKKLVYVKTRNVNVGDKNNKIWLKMPDISESYHALIHILVRSEALKNIVVQHAYSGYTIEYSGNIAEVPVIKAWETSPADRGEYTGCFVTLYLPDGDIQTSYYHAQDISKTHRAFSKSENTWKAHTQAMTAKSAIMEAVRYIPVFNDLVSKVIEHYDQSHDFDNDDSKKEKISEQAVNWINEQIQEKGVEMNDFMAFLKKNRCGSIEDINNQFFDTVEKMLNSKEVVKDAK